MGSLLAAGLVSGCWVGTMGVTVPIDPPARAAAVRQLLAVPVDSVPVPADELVGNTLTIDGYYPGDLFRFEYRIYLAPSGRAFTQYTEVGYGLIPVRDAPSHGDVLSFWIEDNRIQLAGQVSRGLSKRNENSFTYVFRGRDGAVACHMSGMYRRDEFIAVGCGLLPGNALRLARQGSE